MAAGKDKLLVKPTATSDCFDIATFAKTSNAIVGIEIVVEPVPVEVPTLAVLVDVRDVPVAVRVHSECAGSHPHHHLLNVILRLNIIRNLKFHSSPRQVVAIF
mgnify:CR=1 FL=1